MTARALGPVGDDANHIAGEGRIVVLHPDRTDANGVVHALTVGHRQRCVYCGWPTAGMACRAHRDLLGLDPCAA